MTYIFFSKVKYIIKKLIFLIKTKNLFIIRYLIKMNFDKKSFIINSNKEPYNNNEFSSLWNFIASKIIFYKIKINISDELNKLKELKELSNEDFDDMKEITKNFRENINQQILKQLDEYLKINFDIEISNYHVVYRNDNDNYVIIINKNYFELFNSVFIVKDKSQSNRYFVGFTFNTSVRYSCKISGIIIYFSSSGILIQRNILNKIVSDFNLTNSYINETNTIFYNQTLLFYTLNFKYFNLCVNLLDYNDILLYNNINIDTQILTNDKVAYFKFIENLNPRFLHLKKILKFNESSGSSGSSKTSDLNESIFIDLGSLKKESITNINSMICLKLDYYSIIPSNNLDKLNDFFDKCNKFEEVEYSDEYPTYCIKCNELLSITEYYSQSLTINLGNSFCTKCEIRYSKKENSWICCKLSKELDNDKKYTYNPICTSKLYPTNNYQCANTNLHSDKFNLKFTKINNMYKFPNKEIIKIFPKKI